jgi:hypothetical protein
VTFVLFDLRRRLVAGGAESSFIFRAKGVFGDKKKVVVLERYFL